MLEKKKIEAAQEGMARVSDTRHGFLCLFDYTKIQKYDSLASVKPDIIRPIKKDEEGTIIIIIPKIILTFILIIDYSVLLGIVCVDSNFRNKIQSLKTASQAAIKKITLGTVRKLDDGDDDATLGRCMNTLKYQLDSKRFREFIVNDSDIKYYHQYADFEQIYDTFENGVTDYKNKFETESGGFEWFITLHFNDDEKKQINDIMTKKVDDAVKVSS